MVREFSEDAPGWIYDHTAYGYTVTYTATCDVPVTGDSMNLPLLASMMMLSFGMLIGLLRKGKRQ